MATFNLFIRSKDNTKLVNIYVRLKDGRAIDQTAKTGFFILPQNWSNPAGTVRQKADFQGKDEFRENLKEFKRHLEDEFLKTKDKQNLPNDWLRTAVDKYQYPEKYRERKVALFNFIEAYIKQSETRVNPANGKLISLSTRRKYGTCFNHLKNYSGSRGESIDFENVTLDFYYKFTEYLTKECNLATNSVGKQIAILKGFLNEATDQGLNTKPDFRGKRFKIITEESEAIYLDEGELEKIRKKDLNGKKYLDKVRDLFLVGCWTGCRFSDFTSITPQHVKNGFLQIEQEKTGNRVTIPLHPVVKEILEKYRGELPKSPSNQKFNDYIKDVCEAAEINSMEMKSITKGGKRITEAHPKWELVTSHTARRSFATNLYKSGFPSISIMGITGHRTEKAFLKYIKVTPEEHAMLLQKHWSKAWAKQDAGKNGEGNRDGEAIH